MSGGRGRAGARYGRDGGKKKASRPSATLIRRKEKKKRVRPSGKRGGQKGRVRFPFTLGNTGEKEEGREERYLAIPRWKGEEKRRGRSRLSKERRVNVLSYSLFSARKEGGENKSVNIEFEREGNNIGGSRGPPPVDGNKKKKKGEEKRPAGSHDLKGGKKKKKKKKEGDGESRRLRGRGKRRKEAFCVPTSQNAERKGGSLIFIFTRQPQRKKKKDRDKKGRRRKSGHDLSTCRSEGERDAALLHP